MHGWEKHLLGVPVTRVPALVPGVAAAGATVWIAMQIAGLLGAALLRAQGVDPSGRGSPISAISVAVILGIAVSNAFPLPGSLKPGFDFAVKKLLRLGIILVGVKLSLVDVATKGLWGIPVVAIVRRFERPGREPASNWWLDAPPAALHDIDTEDPETVLTGLPGAAGSAHVEVSDIRTSLDAAVPHAFLARTRT